MNFPKGTRFEEDVDPETGQVAWINTKSRGLRQRWRSEQEEQEHYLSDLLGKSGVDVVNLSTDGPVVEPLARLFDQRRRRL